MLAIAALTVGPLALPAQAAPVTIDLLTMNDFHGRLETSGSIGGAAVLAGAINAFEGANPNTVVAAAGDLIGASTFTSFISDDDPTINALNESGLQVSSVGNHEYDQGWADLRDDVIGDNGDGSTALWQYLAANIALDATGEPAPETPPYHIIETGGVNIGFVGAVTEDLPSLVSPAGIEELEVLPIIESVNAVAADLSDGDDTNGEADVVIMLVHEDAEGAIAEGVSADVDAIVAGHSHETYAFLDDTGRPVIQTGQYATNIGHINMTVDPDTGEIVFNDVENLPLMTCDEDTGECTPNYEPDPEVQAIVDDAVEVAAVLGAEPLGVITQNITRSFDITEVEGELTLAEDRGEESTLGNLVADAQRAATDGSAQIAFMNPGGLRADLCVEATDYPYEEVPDFDDVVCAGVTNDDGGVITFAEAATVQPFGNTLVRMSLTGAQIQEALEQQVQPEGSSRPFLHLGVSDGFEYTYESERNELDQIIGIDILEMTLDGAAIDPAASYEVVVNSFLAAGGDNFLTFAAGANPQDTGQIDLESFVDYMAANSPVSPDLQERAIDVGLLGEVTIEWPGRLGDPPAMRAGTDAEWSLNTELPFALPEDFVFTADLPDGITAEFGEPGPAAARQAYPITLDGLPAEAQTLPFTIAVDEDLDGGLYELVFVLDRAGEYSVFDGNPIPTPISVTVELKVAPADENPGGPIDTGSSAPAEPDNNALLLGLAALAAVGAGGWLAVRRRSTAA